MRTDTETLIEAMRILSRDIDTEDGVANAAIYEAAERLGELVRERDDLRAIFPKILEALESGACAATCSVDFLREIPREVKLVRQRLERERDEAIQARKVSAADWLNQIANADLRVTRIKRERDEWKEVAEGSLLGAIKERDEAVRSCQMWQDGYRALLDERDLWKAEAERWRNCQKDD